MQAAESVLREQSESDASPFVKQVLSSLGNAIMTDETNVEANTKLWNRYAKVLLFFFSFLFFALNL